MTSLSPPPRRPRRELLAALASGFVGALALATSTYNVYLQRQQVRAQVWPRLTFATSLTPSNGLTMTLTNRGVGPAELRRVRVKVDGKPVEDLPDMIGKLLRRDDFQVSGITPIEGQVVSPGLELNWLKIENLDEANRMVREFDRLDLELCYCSTLDECWVLGSEAEKQAPTTRPIGACVPDPTPFASISEHALNGMLLDLARDGGINEAGVSVHTAPPPDGG